MNKCKCRAGTWSKKEDACVMQEEDTLSKKTSTIGSKDIKGKAKKESKSTGAYISEVPVKKPVEKQTEESEAKKS